MNIRHGAWFGLAGLFVMWCAPAHATVQFVSIKPSHRSPQQIGTAVTWTVTATDTNPGPLTFQFNVAPAQAQPVLVRDFNAGTFSSGEWTSPPFTWVFTGAEGTYNIRVVIKDFASGETAAKAVQYQITPLVTGSTPVAVATANPLVALFSAPSCASGSSMRVQFQPKSQSTPATVTNWVSCQPLHTMTFEIAGMYPNTAYRMFSQTNTSGQITKGPAIAFTTGSLPGSIPFPTFQTIVAPGTQTDTTDSMILHNLIQLGQGTHYPDVATDLAGNIMWYYYSSDSQHMHILTRPLRNGVFLTLENGVAWNPATKNLQYLRQIDMAGNIIRETNTGVLQQELPALGATDAGPCSVFPSPAPVGSACLGAFHHDAIQTLPNGYIAVLCDIEKIFPPGTQGDTSGLPVDILGDMIVVLDAHWQAVWYFDSFEHDGGAPQLDINRPAVLGETCVMNQTGCPPTLLLGAGIAPKAHDWLHSNSLYYRPQDGDILFSTRHQDWILKVDYNHGSGTGNILWRMGLDGDFTFLNNFNDPYPWFSHQHDAGIESNEVLTLFDNGNTRISPPPLGLGYGNSRGMALTFDEGSMQVTPVLSVDLGVYANAMGSAQLLANANYFFLPPIVLVTLNSVAGYSIEILPTPGTDTGTQVLNLEGPEHYRAWRMPNLYSPPST
jgi:arylsulfate sulfotransferase